MNLKIVKQNVHEDGNEIQFDVGPYTVCILSDNQTFFQSSSEEPYKVKTIIFNRKKDDQDIDDPFSIYYYKNTLFKVDINHGYTEDEIKLLIKETYYNHNEKFKKLQKEIQLFESIETRKEIMSREPIPEQVRFSVWRRDEGKCVQCGSNKGLEFDHIIPFSKGGSNTERNLQLLCEKCNRGKSANI